MRIIVALYLGYVCAVFRQLRSDTHVMMTMSFGDPRMAPCDAVRAGSVLCAVWAVRLLVSSVPLATALQRSCALRSAPQATYIPPS